MAVFGLWRISTGELIVNVTNIRYWYPIFPPLVMGAFGSLGLLIREYAPARRLVLLAPALPVVVAALAIAPGTAEFRSCASQNLWRNEPMERWNELRSWFASEEAKRYDLIWTDRHSSRLAPVFMRTTFGDRLWHGDVRRFPARRPLSVPPADLILVHKRFQGTREELWNEWSPVFQSADGWMILLSHHPGATGESPAQQPWRDPPTPRPQGQPGECGLSELQPHG